MTAKEKAARDYLDQARHIDLRIEARIDERDRLMARITGGTKELTGMPRGGGHDWTDDAIKHVEACAERISAEIVALCAAKEAVWAAIDSVEGLTLRTVLEMRYRAYRTWEDIAEELGYEVRYVKKLHLKALNHVRVR